MRFSLLETLLIFNESRFAISIGLPTEGTESSVDMRFSSSADKTTASDPETTLLGKGVDAFIGLGVATGVIFGDETGLTTATAVEDFPNICTTKIPLTPLRSAFPVATPIYV